MTKKIFPFVTYVVAMAFLIASCDRKKEENNGPEPEEIFNDGQTGTVTDIDGNTYQTIKIGRWWWMAENLKVTKYADGEDIPANGMFIYNNDESKLETHGRLYTLQVTRRGPNTQTTSSAIPSGIQGVCPTGWHVPSDAEWQLIERRAGMPGFQAQQLNFRSELAGRFKSQDPHWRAPNTGAVNDLGFNALPTGFRSTANGGTFFADSLNAYYWSATNVATDEAGNDFGLLTRTHARIFNYELPSVGRVPQNRGWALSVRCVKDEPED
jgi:uncharacterized protein (TIGR02145 family)